MTEKNTGSILLLSGPVGAGKSTVSQELVKIARHPTVNIEGDQFWFFIARGDESISRSRNFRIIMSSMAAAAIPYAMNGYHVIIDFSVPPWYLERIHQIVGKRGIRLDYVILRPSEKRCAERVAARLEGAIGDYTPYHELYLSFGEAKKYILSDDTSDASVLAGLIAQGLKERKFCVE